MTHQRGLGPAPPIPDLPGIDVRTAMAYCEGNMELLRELLDLLVHGHARSADKIRRLVLEGEPLDGRRLAHSLRAAAGQIGALGLEDAARALETALADDPRQLPEELLAQVESRTDQLLRSIARLKRHLAPPPRLDGGSGGPLGSLELSARCAQLGALIDEDLAGALSLIAQLEARDAEPAHSVALRTIGTCLRTYDLANARARTELLRRTLASEG